MADLVKVYIKDLSQLTQASQLLGKIIELEGVDSSGNPVSFQASTGLLYQAAGLALPGPNALKSTRVAVTYNTTSQVGYVAGSSTLAGLEAGKLCIGAEAIVEQDTDGAKNVEYLLVRDPTGALSVWPDGTFSNGSLVSARWVRKDSLQAVTAGIEPYNPQAVSVPMGAQRTFDDRIFEAKQELKKADFGGSIPSPLDATYWKEISKSTATVLFQRVGVQLLRDILSDEQGQGNRLYIVSRGNLGDVYVEGLDSTLLSPDAAWMNPATGKLEPVTYDLATDTVTPRPGGDGAPVVQVPGQSTTDVMSQKAVTDADTASRSRANHTGTQPISSIEGLQDALDAPVVAAVDKPVVVYLTNSKPYGFDSLDEMRAFTFPANTTIYRIETIESYCYSSGDITNTSSLIWDGNGGRVGFETAATSLLKIGSGGRLYNIVFEGFNFTIEAVGRSTFEGVTFRYSTRIKTVSYDSQPIILKDCTIEAFNSDSNDLTPFISLKSGAPTQTGAARTTIYLRGYTTIAAGITLADSNFIVVDERVGVGSGTYTDEQAQDAAAALLTSGTHSGIAFAYDDASGKLNATVTASPGSGGSATNYALCQVSYDGGQAAASYAGNSFTQLTFNVVDIDTHAGWANGRFTVPAGQAGIYECSLAMRPPDDYPQGVGIGLGIDTELRDSPRFSWRNTAQMSMPARFGLQTPPILYQLAEGQSLVAFTYANQGLNVKALNLIIKRIR